MLKEKIAEYFGDGQRISIEMIIQFVNIGIIDIGGHLPFRMREVCEYGDYDVEAIYDIDFDNQPMSIIFLRDFMKVSKNYTQQELLELLEYISERCTAGVKKLLK